MQDVSPPRRGLALALLTSFVLLWPVEVWMFDSPLAAEAGRMHLMLIVLHAGIGVYALSLTRHLGLPPAWCARGLFALLSLAQVAVVVFAVPGFVGRSAIGFLIVLSFFQLVVAIASLVFTRHYERGKRFLALRFLLGGASVLWSFLTAFVAVAAGASWGRPLRVRGRQLHPNLKRGADWTRGARPDPHALDRDTRLALEALWLHDAQKEHASVPAFSRVSWLLAAVGAPAELLVGSHRAALEEIDHAQRCFALAAGYAGRSFTVEAMPDLLLYDYRAVKDPLVTLAVESLSDGCQLEDFNADVAAACAALCEEEATRDVLERIAREERSHAEFSWEVLAWTLRFDRARVLGPVRDALAKLETMPRPTAVSSVHRALVARADAVALRKHGRMRDDEWGELWTRRTALTRARVETMLHAFERSAA